MLAFHGRLVLDTITNMPNIGIYKRLLLSSLLVTVVKNPKVFAARVAEMVSRKSS